MWILFIVFSDLWRKGKVFIDSSLPYDRTATPFECASFIFDGCVDWVYCYKHYVLLIECKYIFLVCYFNFKIVSSDLMTCTHCILIIYLMWVSCKYSNAQKYQAAMEILHDCYSVRMWCFLREECSLLASFRHSTMLSLHSFTSNSPCRRQWHKSGLLRPPAPPGTSSSAPTHADRCRVDWICLL